ncbi:hypothetical protein AN958_07398 [Leucoagaricus sp. SymC.cos]|nr:hypothetical protein AN958_07398 [Leucoagaricus sp. SymC.cos]
MSYPDAPRSYAVPLPGTPVGTAPTSHQGLHGMFPISLDSIAIGQQIELENIILTTPVHVHTPIAHVGLINGTFPGQTLTALNAVMFLKQFSGASIDRNMYAQLSPEVKARAKATFMQRNSAALDVAVAWSDFMAGRNVGNGPVGRDLLLGAPEVWGVESVSLGRFSAIHLA